MSVRELFATQIYVASLESRATTFRSRLLRECLQLRHDDAAGRHWSEKNYPGGYTSYNSLHRLQLISPAFAELERRLATHVRRFTQRLHLDMKRRRLAMTDCWLNIMPKMAAHGLHLHPLSTLSGTYYVSTPRGCPGLKFEDPRLDRLMAAPPRRHDSPQHLRPWVTIPAQAGKLVLFESWLRHEVPPNLVAAPRISISFNYNWF